MVMLMLFVRIKQFECQTCYMSDKEMDIVNLDR